MFDRLKAQSGAFLISAFHERFEREEVLKWNAEVPLYAHHVLEVPFGRKPAIIDELQLLNVTIGPCKRIRISVKGGKEHGIFRSG